MGKSSIASPIVVGAGDSRYPGNNSSDPLQPDYAGRYTRRDNADDS